MIWKVTQPNTTFVIVDVEFNHFVAETNDEDNARLIAATPELLESLQAAEKLIAAINYAFYAKGTSKALMPVMDETKPFLAEIRATIKKAKKEMTT